MANARPNLFMQGFTLARRCWAAVLWTYALNLLLSWLSLAHTHSSLAATLDGSLAGESLKHGFDLATVITAFIKVGQGNTGGTQSNYIGIPLYVLAYFFLVPGTLFTMQTGERARLSTLLGEGLRYFWRFVRITLLSFVVFALVLGPLLALYHVFDVHLDEQVYGGFSDVVRRFAFLVIIGLVAALLRVFFDLVEVYTVELGLTLRADSRPDRRVRRAFRPAWRTLRRNFVSLYGGFVLLAALGLSAVIVTARIAMHSLAQPRVWPMFLLAQIGLFAMLFTRFWQRGLESAAGAADPLPALKLANDSTIQEVPRALEPLPPVSSAHAPGSEIEGLSTA